MKKLYFILFFLISSFLSYGQKTFTGASGIDYKWSRAANWQNNSKPNAIDSKRSTLTKSEFKLNKKGSPQHIKCEKLLNTKIYDE